jgi:hypothetical protein
MTRSRNYARARELEHVRIAVAWSRAGSAFEDMERRLAKYTKKELWQWGKKWSGQSGGAVEAPSRTARRSKKALTAWFCEWAPEFPDGPDGTKVEGADGDPPVGEWNEVIADWLFGE